MSEWISSRDRLPERPGNYIVFIQDPFVKGCSNPFEDCSYVSTASYTTDDGLWRESEDSYYCANLDCVNTNTVYYISHWMPMPSGPYDAKPVTEVISTEPQKFTKESAQQLLKNLGVLDDNGNVTPEYKDIFIKAEIKEAQNNG